MVSANQMQMLIFAKEQPLKTVSKDIPDKSDNGFKQILDSKVESYRKPLKVSNRIKPEDKPAIVKVKKRADSRYLEKTDLRDSEPLEDIVEPDRHTEKSEQVKKAKDVDKEQQSTSELELELELDSELDSELDLEQLVTAFQQILNTDTTQELAQEELKALAEQLGINLEEIKQIQESLSSFMQKAEISLPKMKEILNQLVEKTVQGEAQGKGSEDVPLKVEIHQSEQDIKVAFQQMQKEVAALVEKIQQKVQPEQTLAKEQTIGISHKTKTEVSMAAQTSEPLLKEELMQKQQPENAEPVKQDVETEIPVVKAKAAVPQDSNLNGQANTNSNQAEFQQAFIQANEQQNSNPQVSEVKQSFSMPSQAMTKNIMEQVVDKAQVIVDENKSEMIMDLKPESLGKLSLKIVHERGQIMAKFVAESEQVKAVIESNMQLLKDSLEKQGLSVQGFSVSVNQDSSRHQHSEDSRNQMRKPGKARTSNVTSESVEGIYEKPISDSVQNGYLFVGQPSINLTA